MIKLSNFRSNDAAIHIDASITSTSDAYLHDRTKNIVPVGNKESWRGQKEITLGTEGISGRATIVIDLQWLRRLTMAAARSKSRQATTGRGGVTIKFTGVRNFTAEGGPR